MKVRPLHDRILVRRIEGKETPKGGIIIPDTATEKPQRAEVIKVGPGRVLVDGTVVRLDLKAGDTILLDKYAGPDVKIDGDEYLLLREDDVLAVLGDAEPVAEVPTPRAPAGRARKDEPRAHPHSPGETRFAELTRLVEKNAPALLADRQAGIRCLAIGRKSAKPFEPDSVIEDLCITAYVDRKLPESRLPKGASVAAAFSAHAFGGRTATETGLRLDEILDVVECGSPFEVRNRHQVPAAQRGRFGGRPPRIDPQRPHGSLKCGLGITNPRLAYPEMLSVGTLGFFVRDEHDAIHLVSNNHVIGESNAAQLGEPVVQPGTLDLTALEIQTYRTEADLVRFFGVAEVSAIVQLQYATRGSPAFNDVDAAMARLTLGGTFRRQTEDLARLAFSGRIMGVAAAYDFGDDDRFVGDPRVYKVGRTTGFTEGRIRSLAGTAAIGYEPRGASGPLTAYFRRLLVIEATADNEGPFSDHGDSGSAILTASHDLAGLLFAGSAQQTLASPVEAVLRELEAAYNQRLSVVTA